ncbi:MAG: NAD(P)H-hydrate dehydratase [Calditrichia bacterium]
MIKIVNSSTMREMDRFTIEEIGIPGVVLMENAGVGVFRILQRLLKDLQMPLIHVYCGKGNNGGDGFVVARHLWDNGVAVRVFIVGKESDLKGDARINFNIIKNLEIPIHFINTKKDLAGEAAEEHPDIVVDALLGTGINGPVKGFMAEVIRFINELHTVVVSVDVPSGLSADTPLVEGIAINADLTVTMALPKICHLFYPAREYVGELFIADIGIPQELRDSEEIDIQVVEKSDIVLPIREPDAHKYKVGKVAVLAGSEGYTGAAALSAEAALQIGAGLVKLAIPGKLNPVVETKLTEVITVPYKLGNKPYLTEEDLTELEDLFGWCDVLALGPGLGRAPETITALSHIFKEFEKPMVIDADALFVLAQNPALLQYGSTHWVLTPHAGEFYRFFPGLSREEFSARQLELAQKFAGEHNVTLLLKGAPSLVVNGEDGQIFVNSTGNAALAKGGSGDVLTGLVAGLMAQHTHPVYSAMCANFLLGLVADTFVEDAFHGSLTASKILNNLDKTIQRHFFEKHHHEH